MHDAKRQFLMGAIPVSRRSGYLNAKTASHEVRVQSTRPANSAPSTRNGRGDALLPLKTANRGYRSRRPARQSALRLWRGPPARRYQDHSPYRPLPGQWACGSTGHCATRRPASADWQGHPLDVSRLYRRRAVGFLRRDHKSARKTSDPSPTARSWVTDCRYGKSGCASRDQQNVRQPFSVAPSPLPHYPA